MKKNSLILFIFYIHSSFKMVRPLENDDAKIDQFFVYQIDRVEYVSYVGFWKYW